MGVPSTDRLSLDVIRVSLTPNFEAGTVQGAFRPRDHFDTDRGFNFYNSNCIGREALAVQKNGRCVGNFRFQGVRYALIRARVIWALYHGKWPEGEIGHRNEIMSDDRIENLREQTRSESLITRILPNRTGVVGVYPLPNGKFFARVTKDREIVHVGCFGSLEEARHAREKTALRLQGEFARIVATVDEAVGAIS